MLARDHYFVYVVGVYQLLYRACIFLFLRACMYSAGIFPRATILFSLLKVDRSPQSSKDFELSVSLAYATPSIMSSCTEYALSVLWAYLGRRYSSFFILLSWTFPCPSTNLWTLAFHLTSFPPLDMGGNIVSWLSLLTHSRPSHSINAYSAPLSHRQSECSPRCILSPRIIDECVDFANTLCRCVPLCRSSLLRGTTPIHVGLPRANFFPFYPLWWYQ